MSSSACGWSKRRRGAIGAQRQRRHSARVPVAPRPGAVAGYSLDPAEESSTAAAQRPFMGEVVQALKLIYSGGGSNDETCSGSLGGGATPTEEEGESPWNDGCGSCSWNGDSDGNDETCSGSLGGGATPTEEEGESPWNDGCGSCSWNGDSDAPSWPRVPNAFFIDAPTRPSVAMAVPRASAAVLLVVVASLACLAFAEPPPSERSALLAFLTATPHELGWNTSTPACA
ncbi:hypothetical protein ZWY2020_051110 [Hordeum vulgare]|nr:hypothetical protein ZWY2020_051110 [Hordeum vulgare]